MWKSQMFRWKQACILDPEYLKFYLFAIYLGVGWLSRIWTK